MTGTHDVLSRLQRSSFRRRFRRGLPPAGKILEQDLFHRLYKDRVVTHQG